MTYETYEPLTVPADAIATEGRPGPWQVALEYSNNGQAKPPTIVQVGSTVFADRGQAMAAAQRTAFEHDPPDPWSPRGREVFRDGPDGFLVIIAGATATFHMSVRLVQPVPDVS